MTGSGTAQTVDLAGLMRQIADLTRAGKLAEATSLGRKLVAEAETVAGKEHPLAATALFTLSQLHTLQGQHDHAENLLKRVLAIREKALGLDHVEVAATLASLADVAIGRARYAEAERHLQRALAIRERTLGSDHYDTAMTLMGLGRIRHAEARYGEAEALFGRAVAALRKSRGPERMLVATALNNLALVSQEQGHLAIAEARLREALARQQEQFGSDSFAVAHILNNLGELHVRQGRFAEAEGLHRRALQISEKALGPDHADVALYLGNLATVFTYQGRASEAEGLQLQALAIEQKALGSQHPKIATRLNNLAHTIDAQGRKPEAEALHRRALAMREALVGPVHDSVASSLTNLAVVLYDQRRFEEALNLARRSLAIRQELLGAEHPRVGDSLNDLGVLLDSLQRYNEVEPLLRRALAIREVALGPSHPDVAVTLHNLASHYRNQRVWPAAYASFKRSYGIWVARRSILAGRPEEGRQIEDRSRIINPYLGLVVAAYHLADGAKDDAALKLRAEAFESAQWAGGASANAAIARMAARFVAGGGQLGQLVRERQDLAEQASATDRALIALMSKPVQQRASGADAALRQRGDAVAQKLKEVDNALGGRFPQYAVLVGAGPIPLREVAGLLGPREVLLLFASDSDNTYLWAVTHETNRWLKIPLGSKALGEHVAALRCGLDSVGAWRGEGAQRCMDLLKLATPPGDADQKPFDLARAHALYRALLGQVEDLIEGKQHLIVPAGPLTSLPFHVLVASPPSSASVTEASALDRADWLARRVPISVLPYVASLKALRRLAQQSQAKAPFIGFGNPLLTGPAGTDRRAWQRQSCGPAPARGAADRGRAGPAVKLLRRGLAHVEEIRRQQPLPETADELCTVARLLGAPVESVHLGANATERRIKELSTSGTLKGARFVHFATHGLLASEAEDVGQARGEPALLLTPPQQASEEDDGLLTASEVAQLKLDADWVIMSACNTAAGDKLDGEALSGLARAFFYAGSRALLVSHWYVDSDAAVALVTKAFAELGARPGTSRAEALRRAMLALIEAGGHMAHPANWAPFVVVGEGGVDDTGRKSRRGCILVLPSGQPDSGVLVSVGRSSPFAKDSGGQPTPRPICEEWGRSNQSHTNRISGMPDGPPVTMSDLSSHPPTAELSAGNHASTAVRRS